MSLAPGARIGPYEIVASLGVGGMGEVYRARDPCLDRAVAIKILLSPHGASPTQLERFQREAQSLARISHPHICTLHDVGQHDGVAFLVMELLEGETLADRLERGPIPIDQALESTAPSRVPYVTCIVVGLGGLFAGVTGPLLSAFVPLLVRDAIGEHRTAIGAVMAIDNVLLLLLVPWAGAASDRASASGRGRLAIILAGFVLASAGMALFASPVVAGTAGLIAAMVLLYTGINV